MIASIEEYIGAIRIDTKESGFKPYAWFRGEPKVDTPLLPKLYRPRPDGRVHSENQLLQMFRMKAPSFAPLQIPDRKSTDQWLFLAQHVGVPTRLLDWTENALLALHFALPSEEPTVWMLNPIELNRLSLVGLSGDPRIKGSNEFPLTFFQPEVGINIGYENIRGAWEEDRRGVDLPVAVHPTYIHPRMSIQRSVFTIHGRRKEPINDLLPSDILKKYEIDPEAKQKLRADLKMMGIQETSAFPDLDGLARELEELY